MAFETKEFTNLGMDKDSVISKAEQTYAFHNHNIRISAAEDSTVLSVTSEKGPEHIPITIKKRKKHNKVDIRETSEKGKFEVFLEYIADCDILVAATYDGIITFSTTILKGHNSNIIPTPQDYKVGTYQIKYTVTPSSQTDYIYWGSYGESINDKYVYENCTFQGSYVGHCILGDYFVLFTRGDKDCIYKFNLVRDKFNGILLYEGNLAFEPNVYLDTMAYYESETIQKVYWTDGINQPRFINIVYEGDYIMTESPFNFTPTVKSVPKVKIKKNYKGLGLFPSGTIQYYISYYNKHGAESGIVFSSATQYLSLEDRGAKADEPVSCSFDITMSNLDRSYDYVRVYSAKRTSLNGPFELNIVADVPITSDIITITDTNSNQETVDPNIIYFIGGKDFTAETLTQKNDTLFLGGIQLKGDSIGEDVKTLIRNTLISKTDKDFYDASYIKFTTKCFSSASPSSAYDYNLQTKFSSRMFKTFKRGETYRFAIQFLSKSGVWTDPVWIGDKECTVSPDYDGVNSQIIVPDIEFKLPTSIQQRLSGKYLKYRILMAETTYTNRSIVAQGVVCPTIFNYKERYKNGPFSVSSYIMRPRKGNASWNHFSSLYGEIQGITGEPVKFSNDTSDGAIAICVGLDNYHIIDIKIYSTKLVEDYGPTKLSEIAKDATLLNSYYNNSSSWSDCYDTLRNAFISVGLIPESFIDERKFLSHTPKGDSTTGIDRSFSGSWGVSYHEDHPETSFHFYIPTTELDGISLDVSNKQHEYYVDSSIVSFHTPEFDDVQDLLTNADLAFRIVGIVPITASYSDAQIDMNTKGIAPSSGVVVEKDIVSNFHGTPRTLIKGDFYSDYAWSKEGKDFIYPSSRNYLYPIYMWQKEGSVIGQNKDTFNIENGSKKEFTDIKAELKSKIFATQRFSYATTYIPYWNSGISRVSTFNSDEVTLGVIKGKAKDLYYQGNYDKLIVNEKGYKFRGNSHTAPSYKVEMTLYDPVRINYKSTPHAIFTLESSSGIYNTLPRLKGEGTNSYIPTFGKEDTIRYPWDSIGIDYKYKCLGVYYYDEKNLDEIIAHINKQLSIDDGGGPYDLRDEATRYTVFALLVSTKSKVPTSYHRVLWTRVNKDGQAEYYISKYVNGDGISTLTNAYNINMIHFTTKDDEDKVKLPSAFKLNGHKIEWEYISSYKESEIDIESNVDYPYLYMAELYRIIPYDSLYGGTSDNALERINWIPISDYYDLDKQAKQMEGDTYYQRWDCLKTYPYTEESVNKVVDITSFMVETHKNIDGRCDINRGNQNLLNARPTNFNLFNNVYSQQDTIFRYNVLDSKFNLSKFENQITWSLTKSPTEDIDSWTSISLNSSIYLDGTFGKITKLLNVNDNIVAFQDKAVSTVLYNERVQISTESGAPVEIQNSNKVTGYDYVSQEYGCQNKNSVVTTKSGVYFIDSLNRSFNKFSKEGVVDVSTQGMISWFRNNDTSNMRTLYDSITHDIYLVDTSTCLVYNEDLNRFTSFMNYDGALALFNLYGRSYLYDGSFYKMFGGKYGIGRDGEPFDSYIEYRVNPEPYIDKTFTNIEFISDVIKSDSSINDSYSITDEIPFHKVEIWNEYQYGSSILDKKLLGPLTKKFRTWRIQLPRDSKSKYRHDRIRSPWAHIRLTRDGDKTKTGNKMVFHNFIVKYLK